MFASRHQRLQREMAANCDTPPASEAEMAVVLWWNDLKLSSAGTDSMANEFDCFRRYRCSAAQRLSGGYVNFVCRAFLDTQDSSQSATRTSVIVKRFSSSIHNSSSYEIERTALWLCNSVAFHAACTQSTLSVRIPRLLAFDDATRTIVMEDAGSNAKMLSEWLLLPGVESSDLSSDCSTSAVVTSDVASGWPELTADNFARGITELFCKIRTASSAANLLPSSNSMFISAAPAPFSLQVRPESSFSERNQWYRITPLALTPPLLMNHRSCTGTRHFLSRPLRLGCRLQLSRLWLLPDRALKTRMHRALPMRPSPATRGRAAPMQFTMDGTGAWQMIRDHLG
jgi:hypothetical protein